MDVGPEPARGVGAGPASPAGPRHGPPLRQRRATDDDLDDIVELCATSLGWEGDERDRELFRWKHRRNPFGPSPVWVAEGDAGLVGVRAMLRWELATPDGAVWRAVRAVDTATHPDHRGRGTFRSLTTGAVDALTAEGVDLVFNTPNAQSRPGYLSMGWQVLGRVPVAVAVPSLRAVPRLRGARAAAHKWSVPTSAGLAAGEVLAHDASVDALLATLAPATGLRTPRTPAYLRWRYVDGPVDYRVVTLGTDPAEGSAVFRVRRRGTSTEATVTELLVPDDDVARRRRRLLRTVLRGTGADHLVVACPPARDIGRPGSLLGHPPALRAPRLGPVLTWRALARAERPPLADWDLALGDVELF